MRISEAMTRQGTSDCEEDRKSSRDAEAVERGSVLQVPGPSSIDVANARRSRKDSPGRTRAGLGGLVARSESQWLVRKQDEAGDDNQQPFDGMRGRWGDGWQASMGEGGGRGQRRGKRGKRRYARAISQSFRHRLAAVRARKSENRARKRLAFAICRQLQSTHRRVGRKPSIAYHRCSSGR